MPVDACHSAAERFRIQKKENYRLSLGDTLNCDAINNQIRITLSLLKTIMVLRAGWNFCNTSAEGAAEESPLQTSFALKKSSNDYDTGSTSRFFYLDAYV